MKVYTEVNYKWDDEANKLVEVSSKSYDYEGDVALLDLKYTVNGQEIPHSHNPSDEGTSSASDFSTTENVSTESLLSYDDPDDYHDNFFGNPFNWGTGGYSLAEVTTDLLGFYDRNLALLPKHYEERREEIRDKYNVGMDELGMNRRTATGQVISDYDQSLMSGKALRSGWRSSQKERQFGDITKTFNLSQTGLENIMSSDLTDLSRKETKDYSDIFTGVSGMMSDYYAATQKHFTPIGDSANLLANINRRLGDFYDMITTTEQNPQNWHGSPYGQ
tara:strand:+ start:81 stop:908 length:828 start_codon:yes stop_codon:yes gene_type:complete